MTQMRKPKNASSFLNPYLSRRRKRNVSQTVINVPTYSGILRVRDGLEAVQKGINLVYKEAKTINIRLNTTPAV